MVDRDAVVLLAAAQRYADAGRPLSRAKALEAAAECLVEADERTAARQAFEQAVEVYEFLGAEARPQPGSRRVPGLRHPARPAQQAPAGGQRVGLAHR